MCVYRCVLAWEFMILNAMAHAVVAFNTFDTAKTGSIGEKEFKRLISVVNDGRPVFPGNFKNALADFDRYNTHVIWQTLET